MLKKLLVCVPVIAVFVVTGISASAAATSAPKVVSAVAPLAADRAGCTADIPAVKALVKSLDKFNAAMVPQPDVAKLQPILGEFLNEVVDLQKAGCLGPQSKLQDPGSCVSALLDILGGAVKAVVALIPPNMAALANAVKAVNAAIKTFNDAKCLPIPLPTLPDLPIPPIPAPPIPAPPIPPLPGT